MRYDLYCSMGRRGRQIHTFLSLGESFPELIFTLLTLVLLLALVGLAGWQIYSIAKEVAKSSRLEQEIQATWLKRADLFERQRAVREEIERLRSDPEYRRRLLKQQMGYTEEGEVVVVFGGDEQR